MMLDKTSLTSKDSEASASETLMSSHAMKMGLYTINLGTKLGNYEQRCQRILPIFRTLSK